MITITCPHCGFSRRTAPASIPANAVRARCPKCLQWFGLPRGMNPAEGIPAAAVAAGAAAIDSRAVQPPARLLRRKIPFVFTGTAGDYFGVWIVNTLLKIVTLGIYTPWAKVRKRRFFYGHTLLDDVNFDYLANPLALLKGLLLGAVLFLLYMVGSHFSPMLGTALGVLVFAAMPWVIVRSRLFNNRNSTHRNVRFNFKPNYREAYGAFLLAPLLTSITLGLFAPAMIYRQKRFLVENNLFGDAAFTFEARMKDFYLVFLKAFGLAFLLGGAGVALFAAAVPTFSLKTALAVPALAVAVPLALVAGYLLIALYVYVRLTNLTWNGTRLAGNRFVSTMRMREMAWLFGSNAAAVALSFGLLIPWAAVRVARYRLSRLALEVSGSLDAFRADSLSAVSAAGEEIGDIFGVEIGL